MFPVALVAASLLGGCGFLHKHFDRKEPAYQKSPQDRPLEIPPDLNTPNGSGALVIPPGASPAASAQPATPPAYDGAAPAADASVAAPVSSAPGAAIEGDALRVADTVESTWVRVGLALERSGAATITSRDDAGHSYAVETTGQAGSQPGWFKRAITLGRAGAKSAAHVPLTVRVSADGAEASKVSIEGAADEASRAAARALLATLRQRLS